MADRRAYFREYMRKRRAEEKAVNSAAVASRELTHVVLKPFPAGTDRVYQVGEKVNATGWRNREELERQRFIERC